MFTNEMLFKGQCPLVEEFHIKNIMGALERKQWVIGGRVTLSGGVYVTTISSLTGGLIERFDHYQVLAQKINAAPTEETFVDSKTATQFRVVGDSTALVSLIILGTEPLHPYSTKKWAKDYCPFCKAQNFKGIVGSTIRDQALISFTHTQAAGTDTVAFATEVTMKNLTGEHLGQMSGALVSMMEDTDYQVVITKSSSGAIVTKPYATALTKIGFDLVGEVGEEYDVFVFGKILY